MTVQGKLDGINTSKIKVYNFSKKTEEILDLSDSSKIFNIGSFMNSGIKYSVSLYTDNGTNEYIIYKENDVTENGITVNDDILYNISVILYNSYNNNNNNNEIVINNYTALFQTQKHKNFIKGYELANDRNVLLNDEERKQLKIKKIKKYLDI